MFSRTQSFGHGVSWRLEMDSGSIPTEGLLALESEGNVSLLLRYKLRTYEASRFTFHVCALEEKLSTVG